MNPKLEKKIIKFLLKEISKSNFPKPKSKTFGQLSTVGSQSEFKTRTMQDWMDGRGYDLAGLKGKDSQYVLALLGLYKLFEDSLINRFKQGVSPEDAAKNLIQFQKVRAIKTLIQTREVIHQGTDDTGASGFSIRKNIASKDGMSGEQYALALDELNDKVNEFEQKASLDGVPMSPAVEARLDGLYKEIYVKAYREENATEEDARHELDSIENKALDLAKGIYREVSAAGSSEEPPEGMSDEISDEVQGALEDLGADDTFKKVPADADLSDPKYADEQYLDLTDLKSSAKSEYEESLERGREFFSKYLTGDGSYEKMSPEEFKKFWERYKQENRERTKRIQQVLSTSTPEAAIEAIKKEYGKEILQKPLTYKKIGEIMGASLDMKKAVPVATVRQNYLKNRSAAMFFTLSEDEYQDSMSYIYDEFLDVCKKFNIFDDDDIESLTIEFDDLNNYFDYVKISNELKSIYDRLEDFDSLSYEDKLDIKRKRDSLEDAKKSADAVKAQFETMSAFRYFFTNIFSDFYNEEIFKKSEVALSEAVIKYAKENNLPVYIMDGLKDKIRNFAMARTVTLKDSRYPGNVVPKDDLDQLAYDIMGHPLRGSKKGENFRKLAKNKEEMTFEQARDLVNDIQNVEDGIIGQVVSHYFIDLVRVKDILDDKGEPVLDKKGEKKIEILGLADRLREFIENDDSMLNISASGKRVYKPTTKGAKKGLKGDQYLLATALKALRASELYGEDKDDFTSFDIPAEVEKQINAIAKQDINKLLEDLPSFTEDKI